MGKHPGLTDAGILGRDVVVLERFELNADNFLGRQRGIGPEWLPCMRQRREDGDKKSDRTSQN